jgi:hypothetical protein
MTGRRAPSNGRAAELDSRPQGAQTGSSLRRRDGAIQDDLVERYLPEPLWRRLPPTDRWWRGRTILLTWALGYPLEMAWSYGISVEGERAAELQGWMAELEDARLIADLEASAEIRGDGGHLEFASLVDEMHDPVGPAVS